MITTMVKNKIASFEFRNIHIPSKKRVPGEGVASAKDTSGLFLSILSTL
jgi:hypothetical protein